MTGIQWTNLAFSELEPLPEKIAFEIIRQVDLLAEFPELGADFNSSNPRLKGLRQLVIKRNWRIVYDFVEEDETIFVLAIQNCRQALLPIRDLKRRKRRTG